MTTTSVTHAQQLAQDAYDFATSRLGDHITPIFEFLASLNLDRATYCQLENEVSGAINHAEHQAFVSGFLMAKAIENVPFLHVAGD
jgi:hypothetical protein